MPVIYIETYVTASAPRMPLDTFEPKRRACVMPGGPFVQADLCPVRVASPARPLNV